MHPLIRVLCFLLFAAWLAWGGPQRLVFGGALLLALYLVIPSADPRPAWQMIRRLRWFLISLLIIYGWFTPGRPLLFDQAMPLSVLIPTIEGLAAGLLRCVVLVVIVLAVNLLLRTTDRDQLLSAIHGLARPLTPFGLSRERLALRMMLVMDAIDNVRQIVSDRLALQRGGMPGVRAAGEFASDVMARVIDAADRQQQTRYTLTLAGPPTLLQWAWPLLLCLLFWLAGIVV